MKNRYRKLKWLQILHAMAVSFLLVAMVYGILTFLTEGTFQNHFQNLVVKGFLRLGISTEAANAAYTMVFVKGQPMIVLGLFCLCFFLFIWRISAKLTGYLSEVADSLDDILEEEELVLPPQELDPMGEQLEHLKRKLATREQQATMSEKRKNELVVSLAHDLRTPLTSVCAYLTMLEDHPEMPEEERARHIHVTLEKAKRLEGLLNEFFDITKYNVQDMSLEKKAIDLSLMLEQLADETCGLLNEKNMTCEVETQEGMLILGDPKKLARVFDNLLKNAVAYGRENSTVKIQARGGKNGAAIVFTNEGPQIPQKKLELIFEKFYRVDDARSSQTGEAGPGLAIAKQIVELHGGAISAVSDGKNTRFIVNLPMYQEEGKRRNR